MAIATATMYEEWADQYGCPAVILTERPTNSDEVIEFARKIGAESQAECEADEPADLVISFQYMDERLGRSIGPEIYTELAVRATLD